MPAWKSHMQNLNGDWFRWDVRPDSSESNRGICDVTLKAAVFPAQG